jgi:hypothetical protein
MAHNNERLVTAIYIVDVIFINIDWCPGDQYIVSASQDIYLVTDSILCFQV